MPTPTNRPARRLPAALALALAAVLGLLACGGDGGDEGDDDVGGGDSSDSETADASETGTDTDAGTDTGELDILDELAALPGMRVSEEKSNVGGARFFHLYLRVPVDHDDPNSPEFELFMTLHHRSRTAPTVYYTTGYAIFDHSYEVELGSLVGGNQLIVEKRFNGASVPDAPWSLLDAQQVAADGHQVIETLRAIYAGPWLRTGVSLGGEDAIYHRYHYPDDFAGVVAYVAPFLLGLADPRFIDHFQTAVPQDCQATLEQLQVVMLGPQRQAMIDELAARLGADELTLIGGHEPALETLVLELPWSAWQWGDPGLCASLPAPDDPDLDALLLTDLLDDVIDLEAVTDPFLQYYFAYAYQVFTQLGRPALPLDHLQGLYDPNYVDLESCVPPPGEPLPFDDGFGPAIHAWLAGEAGDVILVHGGHDPWAAGRVDTAANPGVATYIVPAGDHGSKIADLGEAEQAAIEAELSAWIGGPLGHRPPTPEPRLRYPR